MNPYRYEWRNMKNEEVMRRLDVDGWCLIEGVIPDGEVDKIREAVLAAEASKRDEQ